MESPAQFMRKFYPHASDSAVEIKACDIRCYLSYYITLIKDQKNLAACKAIFDATLEDGNEALKEFEERRFYDEHPAMFAGRAQPQKKARKVKKG